MSEDDRNQEGKRCLGDKMKIIWILLLMALVSMSVVIAITPLPELPKGHCNWTQEATPYRNATNFTGGTWGRLGNGSITCFFPSSITSHDDVVVMERSGDVVRVPEFSLTTIALTILISGFGMIYLRRGR